MIERSGGDEWDWPRVIRRGSLVRESYDGIGGGISALCC
jgi:hypothetical protein